MATVEVKTYIRHEEDKIVTLTLDEKEAETLARILGRVSSLYMQGGSYAYTPTYNLYRNLRKEGFGTERVELEYKLTDNSKIVFVEKDS